MDTGGVAHITEAGRAALVAFDKVRITERIVVSELTVGEVEVLRLLNHQYDGEPIDYSEVGLVRLTAKGYILEVTSDEDDDYTFLEITDAGREALARHERQRADDQQRDFMRRIKREVYLQREKWGQRHEPLRWLGILMKEVGEVAQAIIEGKPDEMEKELVQVCAVIVSWAKYRK